VIVFCHTRFHCPSLRSLIGPALLVSALIGHRSSTKSIRTSCSRGMFVSTSVVVLCRGVRSAVVWLHWCRCSQGLRCFLSAVVAETTPDHKQTNAEQNCGCSAAFNHCYSPLVDPQSCSCCHLFYRRAAERAPPIGDHSNVHEIRIHDAERRTFGL
jgi:hypothetical protein